MITPNNQSVHYLRNIDGVVGLVEVKGDDVVVVDVITSSVLGLCDSGNDVGLLSVDVVSSWEKEDANCGDVWSYELVEEICDVMSSPAKVCDVISPPAEVCDAVWCETVSTFVTSLNDVDKSRLLDGAGEDGLIS